MAGKKSNTPLSRLCPLCKHDRGQQAIGLAPAAAVLALLTRMSVQWRGQHEQVLKNCNDDRFELLVDRRWSLEQCSQLLAGKERPTAIQVRMNFVKNLIALFGS